MPSAGHPVRRSRRRGCITPRASPAPRGKGAAPGPPRTQSLLPSLPWFRGCGQQPQVPPASVRTLPALPPLGARAGRSGAGAAAHAEGRARSRLPSARAVSPSAPARVPLLPPPPTAGGSAARHGERAVGGEALPQLPAASPGAPLDRGLSGRGARPRAGTNHRAARARPPSRTPPAPLPHCVASAPRPFQELSVA